MWLEGRRPEQHTSSICVLCWCWCIGSKGRRKEVLEEGSRLEREKACPSSLVLGVTWPLGRGRTHTGSTVCHSRLMNSIRNASAMLYPCSCIREREGSMSINYWNFAVSKQQEDNICVWRKPKKERKAGRSESWGTDRKSVSPTPPHGEKILK